jgi:hypothetical protein
VIPVGSAPLANFDNEIAAEILILASVIDPSSIAFVVTELTASSFEVMPEVATFIFPAVKESVLFANASDVNNVSSIMLFINALVITSLFANV